MILVLNGPNLNLLGRREPEVYGHGTLADLETACKRWGDEVGVQVRCRHSNHEGVLLDLLHGAAAAGVTGLVLNMGAYTHTSVALRDAVAGVALPAVEVHLSNVYARDPFRHHSYLSAVCVGTVTGLGFAGYGAAIRFLAEHTRTPRDHAAP